MNDDRADYLRCLSEDQLRNIVLIPLLAQMRFTDVIEYHGSVEKGKDIICRFRDMIGETRYVGVIVKRSDIHGAVGQAGSAGEVLLQIQQTFDQPYTDIFELKEVIIDECWVVTSGLVKPTAIESIQGTLKKSNLNKLVRFIDQRKLCSLLDRYIPGFWHSDRILELVLHELRSLIVSARSAAEFLQRLTRRDEPFDRKQVDEVARDIALQMVLADHLLDSNHIFATADLRIQAKEADINKVIADVVEQIRPLAERGYGEPRQINFREAPGHPTCEIDVRLVSQATWNIVDNALRYSYPARPVTVAIEDMGRSMDVVVSDFGLGVPPADVDNILRPGFRADNAVHRSPAGAGIGLSVAERIARAHDGFVLIRSCKDPTVFALSLPKERQE